MTKQEYYDLLVQSAYAGTFPSIEGAACRYRKDLTPACKQRCAIGVLIPDELYSSRLEMALTAKSVRCFLEDHYLCPEDVSLEDLELLQDIHDEQAVYDTWNGDAFVKRLNNCAIFKDVHKHTPGRAD